MLGAELRKRVVGGCGDLVPLATLLLLPRLLFFAPAGFLCFLLPPLRVRGSRVVADQELAAPAPEADTGTPEP